MKCLLVMEVIVSNVVFLFVVVIQAFSLLIMAFGWGWSHVKMC